MSVQSFDSGYSVQLTEAIPAISGDLDQDKPARQSRAHLTPITSLSTQSLMSTSTSNARKSYFANFIIQNHVTRFEMTVGPTCFSKTYYISCSGICDQFQEMFHDIEIANKMTIGKIKVAYNIFHGIAPYFHGQLVDSIS